MKKRKEKLVHKIILYNALFCVAIFIIIFIVFSGWWNSIEMQINKMEVEVTREVTNYLDDLIKGPITINETNQLLISNELLNVDNLKEIELFFTNELKMNPDYIHSISYATKDGEYISARRNTNNNIEILKSNKKTEGHSISYSVSEANIIGDQIEDYGLYDARTRPWYKRAVEAKKLVLSPIYTHFNNDDTAFSISNSVYDEKGTFKGVLCSNFLLSEISAYLYGIKENNICEIYIFDQITNEMIANSEGYHNYKQLKEGDLFIQTLDMIEEKDIYEAFISYNNSGEKNFLLNTYEGRCRYSVNEYDDFELSWIIMTQIEPYDFFSV